MGNPDIDRAFDGSIPPLYERYMVPLIFEPYAHDLATRVASRPVGRVLEIAAGTGVLTRQLAMRLPDAASIIATDLNAPMLAMAESLGTARPVRWRQADAMQLPFADASFDCVACQFGAMFFPDKVKAFAEVRRVLAPGGVFAFNVWDRIEENEFPDVVTQALESMFPHDPPRFMARVAHGYFDTRAIVRDLESAGFAMPPQVDTIAVRSRAASARMVALAYCQGTPLRSEIEARDPARLDEATDAATQALARRFGTGAVEGRIQAHVIVVER
ncbi:class I SAM-dependent methyltransferase [Cognatiluteimonas profundi]|uniref:class I SAM-dependent methyltransferase n=1 Tax=Cognatiluteimonas profundi TaxID=2594501 RepID=UPI00131DE9A4|nr:methyltransferase domain-containing protein [Lysobacter profundi]